jgi:hypothetical protein
VKRDEGDITISVFSTSKSLKDEANKKDTYAEFSEVTQSKQGEPLANPSVKRLIGE